MRPMLLKMTAFGPYGDYTEIDFDSLGRSGLYLICGDTGSGKTTIFDAITYALYGVPSGKIRDASMLRSKYASPDRATEVELSFEHGGKLYRIKRNPGGYERTARRGSGKVMEQQSTELYLPNGDVITKKNEVDRAVTDILKIDSNRFSRIAMISQGDFRDLLLEKTEKRKQIFREIFKTGNYESLQEALKEKTSLLKRECDTVESSIHQYIEGILYTETELAADAVSKAKSGELSVKEVQSAVATLIEEQSKQEERLDKSLEEVEQRLSALEATVRSAQERERVKGLLLDTEKRLAESERKLSLCKKALEGQLAREGETELLTGQITAIDLQLPEYDTLEATRKRFTLTEAGLKDTGSQIANKQQLSLETAKRLTLLKAEFESLRNAGERRLLLTAKTDSLTERQEKLSSLAARAKELGEHQSSLMKLQARYLNACAEMQKKTAVYEKHHREYLDAQAGILAQTLSAGTPCPVCGSTEHPRPAAHSESAPTKETLDREKQASEAAQRTASLLSSKAGTLKGSVEEKESALRKEALELLGERELSNVEAAVKAALVHVADELSGTAEAIKREDAKIKRKRDIEEALPRLEEKKQRAEAELSALNTGLASLKAQGEALSEQLEAYKKRLPFGGKLEAEGARASLESQRSLLQGALKKAREAYTEAEKTYADQSGRVAQLKQQLSQGKDHDVKELLGQRDSLTKEKASLTLNLRSVHTRLVTNRGILDNLQKKAAHAEALLNRRKWIADLSNTANGSIPSKDKVMLETYVQMTYFDRILTKANTRLMVMSGGQYELKRRREAANSRSQSGLELDVVDHYTSTERSVNTLSGGEQFKASLSLALGLADLIQSTAGGIQIDTMFVDEGFGSLDPESLQQALRALSDLAESNRLVGIISHVQDLREKIDKQIEVKKDRYGNSRVTVIT